LAKRGENVKDDGGANGGTSWGASSPPIREARTLGDTVSRGAGRFRTNPSSDPYFERKICCRFRTFRLSAPQR
jgi:hypothetical protein